METQFDFSAAFTLRTATVHDVPQLIQLINRAYEDEAFCVRGPRTDAADIAQQMERGAFWLLEEVARPGQLAGAVLCQVQGERGYLGMLSVDSACRGKGMAKYLIKTVEACCRQAGCVWLDLTVVSQRASLIDFYAALGFDRCGELPFPVPEKILLPLNLVKMCKAL